MRGSVRRWRSGWQWRVRTPDGGGYRKSGYRLQGEAAGRTQQSARKMGEGRFVEPDQITVRAYIEDVWLPAVKNSVGPSQYANYKVILERHIKKHIGDVRLQKLAEPQVIRMYRELEKTGHRYSTDEEPRGLSPESVRHVHAMLHRALDDAVEWRYIPRNVADSNKMKPPKPKGQTDMVVWTAAELQDFLSGQSQDRLYPLVAIRSHDRSEARRSPRPPVGLCRPPGGHGVHCPGPDPSTASPHRRPTVAGAR